MFCFKRFCPACKLMENDNECFQLITQSYVTLYGKIRYRKSSFDVAGCVTSVWLLSDICQKNLRGKGKLLLPTITSRMGEFSETGSWEVDPKYYSFFFTRFPYNYGQVNIYPDEIFIVFEGYEDFLND